MRGRILIKCRLVVCTGLHIGGTDIFSSIGAVDSPVVRNPWTQDPIVPGSSLKGKIRTLLVRSRCKDMEHMPPFSQDGEDILRLFGSSGGNANNKKGEEKTKESADGGKKKGIRLSRLQFSDCFVTKESKDSMMTKAGRLIEIKAENYINRNSSIAAPRQIERVNPGVEFDVKIVYNIVNSDEAEIEADLTLLAKGMKLLQLDYLGGHGSRGSGRVSFEDFSLKYYGEDQGDEQVDDKLKKLKSLFQEVEHYGPFSV